MKYLNTFLLALFVSAGAFAADITTPLPSACEAFRPDILNGTILYENALQGLASGRDFGQDKATQKYFWIVYSDRDANPAYVAPNSSTVNTTLEFNEKVRIARIVDGYALVYSEPVEQISYPKISEDAVWKGWVPMKKLLLWDTCPATDAGIYNKAMICINVDSNLKNGRLNKSFLSPDNLTASTDLSRKQMFTYYFVMKNEGDLALLATQNKLTGNTHKVLYGWVDKNSFVSWNQRSCLEPTWNRDDVSYFSKNGIKANIFEDKDLKTKASYITYASKQKNTGDKDVYRMDGDVLRYPILDDNTDDVWNCTTFSAPNHSGALQTSSVSQTFQDHIAALSRINIAFVIDGTVSMEPYFPKVKETILELNKYFSQNMKVRVGVLIYRDKADGPYVTEKKSMTDPSNPELAKWIEYGGGYGINTSPVDQTEEEALYYGINEALDFFQFNPQESNIMFVIGDCGDAGDYPEITEDVLIQKLASKHVNLLGFQVRNETGNMAFPVFNNEVCRLIRGNMENQFNQLDSRKRVSVKPKLLEDGYEFTHNVKNAEGDLYVGSHKDVQSGAMPVDRLKSQILTAVSLAKQSVDHKIELLYSRSQGVEDATALSGSEDDYDVTGPMLDGKWLEDRIGKDLLASIVEENAMVSFKGYTPKRHQASGKEFYKPVIFIAHEELTTMMRRLAPMNDVTKREADDNREPYVKAMKALIQGLIPKISDADMNSMGYNEVMALVAGLNAATTSLKGRTIAEVSDKHVVSAAEYRDIKNGFRMGYRHLEDIQKSPYRFTRMLNGSKYYWIPIEDLP